MTVQKLTGQLMPLYQGDGAGDEVYVVFAGADGQRYRICAIAQVFAQAVGGKGYLQLEVEMCRW